MFAKSTARGQDRIYGTATRFREGFEMKKILGVALVLIFAATASANATALLDFDQTGSASGTISWSGGVLTQRLFQFDNF